jgi:quinol monooxygenase YgiN
MYCFSNKKKEKNVELHKERTRLVLVGVSIRLNREVAMNIEKSQFALIVEFQVKPECLKLFTQLVAENAHASLSYELGCKQFDVLFDIADPCRCVLYEIYEDAAAFTEVHMKAEHTLSFLAAAKELVSSQKGQRFTRAYANAKALA